MSRARLGLSEQPGGELRLVAVAPGYRVVRRARGGGRARDGRGAGTVGGWVPRRARSSPRSGCTSSA